MASFRKFYNRIFKNFSRLTSNFEIHPKNSNQLKLKCFINWFEHILKINFNNKQLNIIKKIYSHLPSDQLDILHDRISYHDKYIKYYNDNFASMSKNEFEFLHNLLYIMKNNGSIHLGGYDYKKLMNNIIVLWKSFDNIKQIPVQIRDSFTINIYSDFVI